MYAVRTALPAVTCIIMFFVFQSASAQDSKHKHIETNLMVEVKAGYGFLIPHRLEMEIFNAHFPSFEINISRKTDGRNRWEYQYGYPIIGIAYWYSSLGSSPYLGDAHAIFPFVNFPITANKTTRLYF